MTKVERFWGDVVVDDRTVVDSWTTRFEYHLPNCGFKEDAYGTICITVWDHDLTSKNRYVKMKVELLHLLNRKWGQTHGK